MHIKRFMDEANDSIKRDLGPTFIFFLRLNLG